MDILNTMKTRLLLILGGYIGSGECRWVNEVSCERKIFDLSQLGDFREFFLARGSCFWGCVFRAYTTIGGVWVEMGNFF